jgi:neutral trehalase
MLKKERKNEVKNFIFNVDIYFTICNGTCS